MHSFMTAGVCQWINRESGGKRHRLAPNIALRRYEAAVSQELARYFIKHTLTGRRKAAGSVC